APASVDALMRAVGGGRVELVTPFQLHALRGDGAVLSAVSVIDGSGTVRALPADTLLARLGLATPPGPSAGWGLQLDHHRIVASPPTCQPSLPGVHAVGDIAAYPHKLKLILTGFAEMATAAHSVFPRVHPDRVLRFEHSTNVGVPKAVEGEGRAS